MKYIYTALFTPRDNGGYEARVPDIPHCVTSGRTLPDAIAMIEDAATLMLVAMEDEQAQIPSATDPASVVPPPGAIPSVIVLDTDAYRRQLDTTPVRKSVSMTAKPAPAASAAPRSCRTACASSLPEPNRFDAPN